MQKEQALSELFEKNRQWARSMVETDREFFSRLVRQQAPRYLWIGCSDSRVPANQIVGLLPGDLFVHRNVSNLVVHTDMNCLSVLQFAVDALGVEHVIVCGHYGCGGVRTSMEDEHHGLIDNWLRHIRDIGTRHHAELSALPAGEARVDRLCELNVTEQVRNVCNTTIVQDAWRRGRKVAVHGWIYGIHNGLLKDLGLSIGSLEEFRAAGPS